MEFASINSPGAAFVAGLITSLHCAGMCGPLACSLMPTKRGESDLLTVGTTYHLSRLTGYAVVGGLAGGIGRLPLTWLTQSYLAWLPWIFVLAFLGLALRWDRHLPKLPVVSRLAGRVHLASRQRPRVQAAALLGVFTPLLPCGPLYFILALALMSGSALRGVEFMLAFGLGTVPLLWLAQSHFHWLSSRLSPLWFNRVRLGTALASALVLTWRLRATFGLNGPDPSSLICF